MNRKDTNAFFMQLEHESNGRDSVQSRGWNQYIYLQVFAGQGESLIDVQQRVLKARLGFVFPPGHLQKL